MSDLETVAELLSELITEVRGLREDVQAITDPTSMRGGYNLSDVIDRVGGPTGTSLHDVVDQLVGPTGTSLHDLSNQLNELQVAVEALAP